MRGDYENETWVNSRNHNVFHFGRYFCSEEQETLILNFLFTSVLDNRIWKQVYAHKNRIRSSFGVRIRIKHSGFCFCLYESKY